MTTAIAQSRAAADREAAVGLERCVCRECGRSMGGALRLPDAANFLGISEKELERLSKRGEVVFVKHGRCTLVPQASLEQYLGKLIETKLAKGV